MRGRIRRRRWRRHLPGRQRRTARRRRGGPAGPRRHHQLGQRLWPGTLSRRLHAGLHLRRLDPRTDRRQRLGPRARCGAGPSVACSASPASTPSPRPSSGSQQSGAVGRRRTRRAPVSTACGPAAATTTPTGEPTWWSACRPRPWRGGRAPAASPPTPPPIRRSSASISVALRWARSPAAVTGSQRPSRAATSTATASATSRSASPARASTEPTPAAWCTSSSDVPTAWPRRRADLARRGRRPGGAAGRRRPFRLGSGRRRSRRRRHRRPGHRRPRRNGPGACRRRRGARALRLAAPVAAVSTARSGPSYGEVLPPLLESATASDRR